MVWMIRIGTEFGNPSIEIPNGATVLKFKILSYRNVIYLKRKVRSCTIEIQQEKAQCFDFRVMIEAGQKFSTSKKK